jgi:hypothetical protein
LKDVDRDGDLDLLVRFSLKDLRRAGALDPRSVDAVFSAQTNDGGAVQGAISLPNPPPRRKCR